MVVGLGEVGAGDVGIGDGALDGTRHSSHPGGSSLEYAQPEPRPFEDQVMLVVVDADTSSGPEVPSYQTPSMVSMSNSASVQKLVTDNVPDSSAVIAQLPPPSISYSDG